MAATAVDFVSAINSLLQRKEKLLKVFSDIESNKARLTELGDSWTNVDAYLVEVEMRLRNTLEDIHSKEAAIEAKIQEASEALAKRTSDIASREESSLVRIQEQKDAAVAIVLELKSKWLEENQQLGTPNEEEDASKKEEISREDEDNAMADASPDHHSNAAFDSPVKTTPGGADSKATPGHTLSLSSLLEREASKPVEVIPRAELKSLCEAMDPDNLRFYIAEHRKDLTAISAELPSALKLANDPVQLVLTALEGYSLSDQNIYIQGSKKDISIALLTNKRACVIMLEALADVLADPDYSVISEETKKSVKEIADSWKSKINLEGVHTSNVSIDAQSFLQLLATFGLASQYEQDELWKFILPIARRKQTVALCRTLELSAKAPDIIESLIKDGKQMEAVTFAIEFGLLDRFQPVPLLKAFLKDCRKSANTLKDRYDTSAAQNDANQRELSALKMVLRIISDLKLEESYPPDPLERRVAQLEKTKFDKRRYAPSGKHQQMKRPRIGDMAQERSYYRPHYAEGFMPYGAAAQPFYNRHAVGPYPPPYAGPARSPASLQSSSMYPSDGSLTYAPPAYNATPSADYSGYSYGTGVPSNYQSYQ